jgi:hypothetical protein
MEPYWQKQTIDKPLYPNLLWSRPEAKQSRGKLLVVGGSSQGFSMPVQAYAEAYKAGAGSIRVVLPDATKKYISKTLPEVEYAPNNKSGGFSREALASFLEYADWSDGTLMIGEMANSSETAILCEGFFYEFKGQLTIANDVADRSLEVAAMISSRPKTILVLTSKQLQKMATMLKSPVAFTSSMTLVKLVESMHIFSANMEAVILTRHAGYYIVASKGSVGSIEAKTPSETSWVSTLAVHAAVWSIQNPSQLFEAVNCAVFSVQNPGAAGEN